MFVVKSSEIVLLLADLLLWPPQGDTQAPSEGIGPVVQGKVDSAMLLSPLLDHHCINNFAAGGIAVDPRFLNEVLKKRKRKNTMLSENIEDKPIKTTDKVNIKGAYSVTHVCGLT